jgi:hypothetical protein
MVEVAKVTGKAGGVAGRERRVFPRPTVQFFD